MSIQPVSARKPLAIGVAIVLAVAMFNNGLRVGAAIAGQTELARTLPLPGARLLAERAQALARAKAPFGPIAMAASRAAAISPVVEPAFAGAALGSRNRIQAQALAEHALALSRRDPEVLAVQYGLARQAGDAAAQVLAAQRLYRLQTQPRGLGPVLGQDLARPAVMAALVAAFRNDDRWRAPFLAEAAQFPPARPLLVQLAERLAGSPRPLTRAEVSPLAGTFLLDRDEEAAFAFRLWRTVAGSPDPLAWRAAEEIAPAQAFDWAVGDHSRVGFEQGAARLEYEGLTSPLTPVAHKRLPLGPGRYRARITASSSGAMLAITCKGQVLHVEHGGTLQLPMACPAAQISVLSAGTEGWIGPLALERY